MRTVYKDYLVDIVNYYQRCKKNGSLPKLLIEPTRRGIRDECVTAFTARFKKEDLGTLTAFFRQTDVQKLSHTIKHCDLDRFKPLVNFIFGKTERPVDINIELLAWLIDYPQRNYDENFAPIASQPNERSKGPEKMEPTNDESVAGEGLPTYKEEPIMVQVEAKAGGEPALSPPKGLVAFARNRKFITVAGWVALLMMVYFISSGENAPGVQGQCMLWVGDHYEPTPCEQKHGDTLLVALDIERLKNFRKILRPDTITFYAEGKIWYVKRNGSIEYFTAGGRHPVDPSRVLRPLTNYMFTKYLDSSQQVRN